MATRNTHPDAGNADPLPPSYPQRPAHRRVLVARGGEAIGLAKLPLKLLARWSA